MDNELPLPTQTKTNLVIPVIASFLVSAVFFGLGGYYFGKQSPTTPIALSTPTSAPTVIPTVSEPILLDWETYRGSAYSFQHPKGLKSDTEAAGTGFESIRFRYMGPKQVSSGRTQTSLFDGYSFVVTKIGPIDQDTPEQIATERRINLSETCVTEVILSDVKQVSLSKGNGVQFSVKNCMGDFTSSYVSNGTNVYEVIQLYVGEPDDQKAYQEITNQIFNSLKFL